MRSLFVKIFLGFWLAMILIGATLVVIALTRDPRETELARLEETMYAKGEMLVHAFEEGGRSRLLSAAEKLDGSGDLEAFLYRGPIGPLSGRKAPGIMRRLALRALETGQMQLRSGAKAFWLAVPMNNGYVVVSRAPMPTKLERILNPRRLGLHLLVTFIVAGFICYLLARSLTSPIKRLRRATRQFADGDLGTRVGSQIRGHDEIADLARDFDAMAERIESLVESRQRLHADISHELRSPLARLNVALELARQQAGTAAAGPLDRIGLEAERLNELIGEILTLSRLQTVQHLERLPVRIDEVLNRVVADADFEARAAGRCVEMRQSVPLSVEGSERLLHRTLDNVVRNAIRHTAEGTSVEIDLRQVGERAVITVRDHGPGVPPDELSKIFDPFFRLDTARTRHSGGAGLGLAIAEEATRVHGGEIRAQNAQGGGLEITLSLPVGPG